MTHDPDRLRDFPSLAAFGDELMRVARADSRSQSRFSLRRRALPLAVALVVLHMSLAGAEGGRESAAKVEFEPGCQPPEGTEVIAGRPYLGPDDTTEVEPLEPVVAHGKPGSGQGKPTPKWSPPERAERPN